MTATIFVGSSSFLIEVTSFKEIEWRGYFGLPSR